MNRKIINTNIRLNLEREADRKAWEHLQRLDRKRYKSYSRAVVAAVNDFFDRQERLQNDPVGELSDHEQTFLEQIREIVHEEMQNAAPALGLLQLLQGAAPVVAPPAVTQEQDEALDAAMDFVDSF